MTTTIYQIYCKDPNITETYVGSTINFYRRVYLHRSNCTNENSKDYEIYLYKFIRNNGGINNWEFKVLNQIEYFDDSMRRRQEQCYIDLIKPELNSLNAYISEEEKKEYRNEYMEKYREENQQYFKEKYKQYYQDNKEEISIKRKDYRVKNKEKLSENFKKWEEENKEYRDEYRKKYREENRDKINRNRRLKRMDDLHKKQVEILFNNLEVY